MDEGRWRRLDNLADAPGELARGDLAHPPQPQLLAPQRGDDNPLDAEKKHRENAEPDILHDNEEQSREGLQAKKGGLDISVADEGADGLDLILDDAGRLGRFDAADVLGAEAQHQREEVIAQAAQHALGQHALPEVDDIFEIAVDQHEGEENKAQAEDEVELADLHPVKNPPRAAAEIIRQGDRQLKRLGRRLAVLERLALDGVIDDALGDIQRHPVEGQRDEDDS